MKYGKNKQKNWPMDYILGGVFVSAMVVLIVWGIGSINSDEVTEAAQVTSTDTDQSGWSDSGYRDYLPGETVADDDLATADQGTEMATTATGTEAQRPEIDVAESLEQVTPAQSDNPESATLAQAGSAEPVTFAQAESAYHAGDFALATAGFETWTDENPHNPWGHYMLGLSQWKSGDPEAAELSLGDALDAMPDLSKAHLNLARVLMAQGCHQEALEQLDTASTLFIDSPEFFRVRGRALHNLERRDEALASYREALLIRSDDVWALNNSGLILIEEGRFEEAAGALALATSFESGVPCFFNNLGIALENVGHPAAAARAYTAGLDLDATYDKAEQSLARVVALGVDLDIQGPDLTVLASDYAASLQPEPEVEGETDVASLDPIF
jgi:tetratricopeptide (TPR) repeat protein